MSLFVRLVPTLKLRSLLLKQPGSHDVACAGLEARQLQSSCKSLECLCGYDKGRHRVTYEAVTWTRERAAVPGAWNAASGC